MFKHQEVWFPDGETHLTAWMDKAGEIVDGKGTYQIGKLRAALRYVTRFGCAVDVGAHIGLWSMQLVKKFREVHAFEPVEEHRFCFRRNVQQDNYLLYNCALGHLHGKVSMRRHSESSGDTVVVPGNDVDLLSLDSLEIKGVDFLKIDVEGFEDKVILGGSETILRDKPVIIVEQKPNVLARNFGSPEPTAVRLLEKFGYTVRENLSGDYIMTV